MLKYVVPVAFLALSSYAADLEIKEAPDFGAEFTQFLKNKPSVTEDETTKKMPMSDAAKQEALRGYADTHIAEGNYPEALNLLGEKPDGTAEWYEIYGSASLGDRSQKKALWAYKEAKKLYEQQGNEKKAHQMDVLINTLTPPDQK
ncbi:MAG: hypothetical protein ACK5MJ_04230 [Alphaproteobacteria bacterium]